MARYTLEKWKWPDTRVQAGEVQLLGGPMDGLILHSVRRNQPAVRIPLHLDQADSPDTHSRWAVYESVAGFRLYSYARTESDPPQK